MTSLQLKSYRDIHSLATFEERFKYLQLHGTIGIDTFGFDRFLNQKFYRSSEWKRIRNQVILRDNGCDFGIFDRPIAGRIIIHHMNPITSKDLISLDDYILDPNYLICVSHDTHNALHYGDELYLKRNEILPRTKDDTCPWKGVKEANGI